ncbi:MAG: aminotransferase class III-fold pyridoxal phosphate-dependent enzyme, partial [Clostridiales bacterium]|nr:aminotransferase class III-fold pyridoxal phosphate-dependent enzyme [Clostridiales bacterium]
AGTHGSTFGGNPIACAGGLAVLERVGSDGFLDEVVKKGDYFREKLGEISEVQGIDGMGLMLGIRLKTLKASDLCKDCLDNGLLVLTAKDKLRLLPPLTISYEEIDKGIEILKRLME